MESIFYARKLIRAPYIYKWKYNSLQFVYVTAIGKNSWTKINISIIDFHKTLTDIEHIFTTFRYSLVEAEFIL